MTLEELGGIGEFIGAAIEIRRYTKTTRLSTLQSGLASVQQIFDAPTRDSELSRIIAAGLHRDSDCQRPDV